MKLEARSKFKLTVRIPTYILQRAIETEKKVMPVIKKIIHFQRYSLILVGKISLAIADVDVRILTGRKEMLTGPEV